ncbi:MAG: hypothetical protein SWO11_20915 [Thermodesulfobacteriota bacterium]|nr:hypothetical protein [Thermodesulfobacteriota bacterium]
MASSYCLTMNNPWLFLNVKGDFIEELSPFHGITELCFEDIGQGFGVNKEDLS